MLEDVSGFRFQVSGWGKGNANAVSGFRFQVSGRSGDNALVGASRWLALRKMPRNRKVGAGCNPARGRNSASLQATPSQPIR